jgi:hypothetical protein
MKTYRDWFLDWDYEVTLERDRLFYMTEMELLAEEEKKRDDKRRDELYKIQDDLSAQVGK